MIISIALAAALVCQADSPPWAAPPPRGSLAAALQAPRTPAPATTPPESPKSIADLFKERAEREAAAKAAEASPPPPSDGYHCRRTATSRTCGTDEEAMRRNEERAKAALDRILKPD